MSRSRLVALGLVTLLVALGAWIHFNFEVITERRHVGYQGEAQRNFLLAATRFYERMGKRTRSLQRPAELDELAPGGTLLLARYRSGIAPRSLERLMTWVEAGGHLIVAAEWHHTRDPLLDRLQIDRRELRQRGVQAPAGVSLPHAPRVMRVVVANRVQLVERSPRAVHRVEDQLGTVLLHLHHGAGQITVVTSMSYLANSTIGGHDHAEFAWQLLQFNPAAPEIAIAARLERPALAVTLVEHAWQALAAAVALLVAWLWRTIPRFGPQLPDPQPARRRLLDHLRASGLYHWTHGNVARLTGAARESCLRKIARVHPGIVALPVSQRAASLARLAGLPEDQIVRALSGQPADSQQFTDLICTLQAVESRLTRRRAD